MSRIVASPVAIQTTAHSVPATPVWFGEVALLTSHLRKQDVLDAIAEQVRFARRRFGQYDVIDFVAVLFGYAISGERTLEAFYQRLRPWAAAFMALFGRDGLPSRSALSRFLAALTPEPVEALRTCLLTDLLARPLGPEQQTGGLWDRVGTQWILFDVDGTREAARQRALPQTADRPTAQRRLRPLCAPGYLGRKRGEVVRTRTTVIQAHTYHWLGTFGNVGNGDCRGELRPAVAAIRAYLKAHQAPPERAVVRLDGQYGTAAMLADLAGLAYVTRGQDYHLLERNEVQTRLHLPPDQQLTHPESGIAHALYDCPAVPIGAGGQPCRIIVATHPATEQKSRVGSTREAVVYELFLTALPQDAFTAADVVALYLHRGAFESALSDEDQEQAPDRWCSHAAWGQESWQIVSQWVWNLRLELGHQLQPEPIRTTEFAPALPPMPKEAALVAPGRAMPRQWQVSPGSTDASLVETLSVSPMVRCAAPLGRRWLPPNSGEKRMAACAWSMRPASGIVAPAGCASTVSGMDRRPNIHAGSVCSCTRWPSPRRRSSGATGAAAPSEEPVCPWCAANGWRSRWSPTVLPLQKAFLYPCPVPSGRIGGSPGKSGWGGMPVPERLVQSRSRCSASQTPLPAFSAWRELKGVTA